MPKIERWENLPEGVRQHLIDRMRDRAIGVADLHQLRLWIETRSEVPEGAWYKDFGSFKICGRGSSPLGRNCRLGAVVCGMLVKQFKFKRNSDKGGFRWTAESAVETVGSYRGFHAVGRTLGDVKEFAALVRWCERTGLLERLSEMHLISAHHPSGHSSAMPVPALRVNRA